MQKIPKIDFSLLHRGVKYLLFRLAPTASFPCWAMPGIPEPGYIPDYIPHLFMVGRLQSLLPCFQPFTAPAAAMWAHVSTSCSAPTLGPGLAPNSTYALDNLNVYNIHGIFVLMSEIQ